MRQILKVTFILINLFFMVTFASDKIDIFSDEYKKNQEIYKNEARKLTSWEIYKNILSFEELAPINRHDAMQKAPAYTNVLLERYQENNDSEAAYYYSNTSSRMCFMFRKMDNGNTASVKQCFDDVINGYKFASKNGHAQASYNIAVTYKEGFGVNKSNLVASKWFTIAAEQYKTLGLEDNFLDSLEQALTLMPDNPKALQLKKEYLNE